MTYRGGEEMGPAAASLLFGDYTPRGRLPWQLPRTLDQVLRPGGADVLADAIESWDLPYDLGATAAQRTDIREPDQRRPDGADDVRGSAVSRSAPALQGW